MRWLPDYTYSFAPHDLPFGILIQYLPFLNDPVWRNMSIQNAYNEWSETYDTDENLTRDLDQRVTKESLANFHFELGPRAWLRDREEHSFSRSDWSPSSRA